VSTVSTVNTTQTTPAGVSSLAFHSGKRLMLFAGRSNPALADDIAQHLGVGLCPMVLKTFSNGEVYCRIEESIRGADVFLVQSICGNPDTHVSANDALVELLMMVDAAVGASAHRVIAVTPWYGYSRQDRKSAPREPISARVLARTLESVGVDRLLTTDLHTGQVQGFFRHPVDHMTTMMMLTDYLSELQLSGELVVLAPDAGRVKLNKKFAERIGADLAILDQEHPSKASADVSHIIGDVAGKTAIVVDDIIDTGATLRTAGEALATAGASRLYAVATHALLSDESFENLRSAPFEQIVVTDTVPIGSRRPENLHVVSCARLLSDSIHRIFTGKSVSEAFDGQNQVF
jgi:ribose-phosphate pyrophosphokinase